MNSYNDPMSIKLINAIGFISETGNGYQTSEQLLEPDDIRTMRPGGYIAKDTLIAMLGGELVGLALVCGLITPYRVVRCAAEEFGVALEPCLHPVVKRIDHGYLLTKLGQRVAKADFEYSTAHGWRNERDDSIAVKRVQTLMHAEHGNNLIPLPPPPPATRPPLGTASTPFEVGSRYWTYSGKLVTIIHAHTELSGYETVQGDDMCDTRLRAGYRYNRESDRGRVTAAAEDCPDNLIPIYL